MLVPETLITEESLDEIQRWSVGLAPEARNRITLLLEEIRRLKRLVDRRAPQTHKGRGVSTSSSKADVKQCSFMRTIGGKRFRCAAAAKYGDFCGYHKPRELKQQPKGCSAKSRTGWPCEAIVLRENLCPTHWLKAFGHVYLREGDAFRCQLCRATFDYWAVEGRGRDRTGSIKRIAKCPIKLGNKAMQI